MINYCICVRSAQPGLCAEEITETRAYGIAVNSEVIDLNQFSRHIALHGSVYKRSDIQAVLIQAVDCLRELLLDGKKVRLGDLGDFSVGISTRGAETPADFTASNIYDVHVNWQPGAEFKNLRDEATFNLVPLQKDVIKALKEQKGLTEKEEDTSFGEGSDEME